MTTLSPGARQACRVAGGVLFLGGLGLAAFGFFGFASGAMDDVESFGASGFSPLPFMAMFMGGGLVMAVGGFLLKLGFLKAAADIVSTETAGAVEHSSAAMGRGLARGAKDSGFQWSPGGRDVVKVRCRSCGALDSEDARFCSSCAKPM